MATCKECLHVEACKAIVTIINEATGLQINDDTDTTIDADLECEYFTDRSRFVELPCKVGDTVYLWRNVCNNILAYSVSKILINSGEPIIEIVEAERRIHMLHLPARELNKRIFFTKEQAEQALKERESK